MSAGPQVPNDFLTVAAAARVASRSTRTIRRAYERGTLHAYRDGNGRGVRIRYADLLSWMTAKEVGNGSPQPRVSGKPHVDGRAHTAPQNLQENLRLLWQARGRHIGSPRKPETRS